MLSEEYLDRRIDKLIGVFTITILFGKFLGDFIAYVLTQYFGMMIGYGIGLVFATLLLIVWPKIEPDDPPLTED